MSPQLMKIKATINNKPLTEKNWQRRTKRLSDIHMKPTLYQGDNMQRNSGYSFRYCNSTRTRVANIRGHGPIRNKGNFFLSPLFPCQFVVRGVTYKSVAHYMQCRKYTHPRLIEQILAQDSPLDALVVSKGKIISSSKKRGSAQTDKINDVILSLVKEKAYDSRCEDWESNREMVMHVGNYMKFTSDGPLCQALLDTGLAPIVEETEDLFWGEGKLVRGVYTEGKNAAGKSLELVRKILRQDGVKPRLLHYDTSTQRVDCSDLVAESLFSTTASMMMT